jgi:hypothetical protein
LHKFFAIRHEFDLEEPHKEKNMMNVSSKLAKKWNMMSNNKGLGKKKE